jgi:hypothetical protein
MGTVVDLEERRAERDHRSAERMHAALMHPSLRWVAGGEREVAHRRHEHGPMALCGAPGALVLAEPTTRLCPECYPGHEL